MSKLFLLQPPTPFLEQVAEAATAIFKAERDDFDDAVRTVADKAGIEAGEKQQNRVESVIKQGDQLEKREEQNADDLKSAAADTDEIEDGLKNEEVTGDAIQSLLAVRQKAEASSDDMGADNAAAESERGAAFVNLKNEILGENGLTGTIEAINAALGLTIGEEA